jgi:hypothetical protein
VYDQIKTQLDSLAELGDDQVTELQAEIISQFEMVEGEDPTPETVDAMTSLADSLDMVRGELSNREAQAAELATRAAEATARVKGMADDEGEEMAMTEEDMPMDEAPAEETPAVDETEEVEAEEMPAEEEEEMEEEEMSIKASASEELASAEVVVDTAVEITEAAELSAEEVVEEVTTEAELSTDEVVAAAEEEVVETPVETEAAAEELAEVVTEAAAELSAEEEVTTEVVTEDATIQASTAQVDGSELSTTTEKDTELSSDEIIETSTALVEEQKEQAVTAAAEQPFEAPADRQPVVQESLAPVVAITAGADIPGYTAGSTIEDMSELSQAMEKRLHSLRRVNGGDGEQHIVASFSTTYAEDRFLGTDAEANSAKIESLSAQALVASGGHGAPVETKYDIFGLGSTTNRPVRDSLPKFQADRGGIRFVTAPSFASGDYADAVGVWTAAVDAAPGGATKESLTVVAAAENTAVTDAVTLQLQFGNLMTRAYPELIARHNELALVAHARAGEVDLLTKIAAASTAVTSGTILGFGRDFLVSVRKAAVAYRSRHRIAQTTTLKALIPDWVFDAMASDLAISMPGDSSIAVGRAEIEGYLSGSNVTLVGSPDMTYFGAQGAAALLEFPDSFDWFLFAEGTFLFLDGGSLDLGIIRDSSLVGTNDYKMFVETFEGVAKVGIESLKITQTVNINGSAAALRDTLGGVAASTIEL